MSERGFMVGDFVWVRFGNNGKQLAKIKDTQLGAVKLRKYRKVSKRWTGITPWTSTKVILRSATDTELLDLGIRDITRRI